MSLSRLFLRLATARALTGRTLAENRVFDSAIDPLDTRITAEKQPVVVVYTDNHADTPEGRAHMAGAASAIDLVIEIAVASRAVIPVMDGDDAVDIILPHTDEGMEMTLDLIERQVLKVLTGSDNQWAVLWRMFCQKILRRESRRASSGEGGVRFAARQLVLTCDPLIEPSLNDQLTAGSAWHQFIVAFEADPGLAPLAPVLRAEFAGADTATWRQAASALGISEDVASRIGLTGHAGSGEDPALLTEATILAGTMPLVPPAESDVVGNGGPLNPETLAWLISDVAGNGLSIAGDGGLFAQAPSPVAPAPPDPGDITLIFDNGLI